MSQPRRGISLVELLAVMSAMSVVLVTLSVWLVLLFRGSDAGHQHLLLCLTQDRLARQFRQDVHQAESWTDTDAAAASIVRLSFVPSRTIDYRLEDGRLVREELSDGKLRRREAYALPPAASATLETSRQHDSTHMTLLIRSAADRTRHGSPRVLRIEAQLGRLHRFVQPTTQEDSP